MPKPKKKAKKICKPGERSSFPLRAPESLEDRILKLNIKKVGKANKKIALNSTYVECLESGVAIEEAKLLQEKE
jgi:hypothetical protein